MTVCEKTQESANGRVMCSFFLCVEHPAKMSDHWLSGSCTESMESLIVRDKYTPVKLTFKDAETQQIKSVMAKRHVPVRTWETVHR